MKIKKAVNVYTLVVPSNKPTTSFFAVQGEETLYFKAKEEAELYQQSLHPSLKIVATPLLAVEDKDKQGKDRWVLLSKVEDMSMSNYNKEHDQHDYYRHSESYEATTQLQQAIKNNPSSVIAVREINSTNYETDSGSGFGGPSSTTHIYDVVDDITKETRFLFVSEKRPYGTQERWFVERGGEISMTDASQLIKQLRIKEIQAQQANLDAEKARLEESLRELQGSANDTNNSTSYNGH